MSHNNDFKYLTQDDKNFLTLWNFLLFLNKFYGKNSFYFPFPSSFSVIYRHTAIAPRIFNKYDSIKFTYTG